MIRAAAQLVDALANMRRNGLVVASPRAFVDGPGVVAPKTYEDLRIDAEAAALRLVVLLVLDIERQGTTGGAVKEGGAA